MRWWKVLGVAAFVGVAATGVVVARAERQRRAYTPDQVRGRLRERLAEAEAAQGPAAAARADAEPGPEMPVWRQRLLAVLRWRPPGLGDASGERARD